MYLNRLASKPSPPTPKTYVPDIIMNLPEKTTVVRIVVASDMGGLPSRLLMLNDLLDHSSFNLHFVFLCKAGRCASLLRRNNANVHEFNLSRKQLNTRAIPKLVLLFRKIHPTIIHSSAGTSNFYSALAARIARVPIMIGEEISVPERRLRQRLKHGLAHNLSTRVIGVSEATTNYLIQSEFCPPAKTQTVYNAYPPVFDILPMHRQLTQLSSLRLVMVSRLSPEKNHATILRALAVLIHDLQQEMFLTIVGDGPHLDKITKLINEYELSKHVELAGYRSDISSLLQSHDLYLLPSTSEGFGIALAEAMRAGVPVLASDVGGIPEVLEGYPQSHLVQPLDTDQWVQKIYKFNHTSLAERQDLSDLGIQLSSSRFSPAIHVQNLSSLYQNLAQRS